MKIGVAGNEAVEDQFVDVFGLAVGAYARVEIGGAAVDEEDDGTGIARGGAAAGED
jgi:hypothetical protein